MLEVYLELVEQDYFELGEAFKGLADENVWKRPAPGLLSVGELAGHIAYWVAVRFAGDGGEPEADLTKCKVSSLLIDPRFRYYQATLATPPSAQHLAMTADQVCKELLRVREESIGHLKAQNVDLASKPPWSSRATYGDYLKYHVFHVAYHTGQMYSARHLLGEETPDN